MKNSIIKMFLPVMILCSILSCKNKNEIVIDSFKEFPEEIQSCACYFSRTKDNLYNGKYIFTDNDNDIGFISINGKMLKLELIGYNEISNTHWIKVFKNKEYEITVDSEQNWQVDQIWHQRAVITIKDNKGKLVTGSEHVFGECGGC